MPRPMRLEPQEAIQRAREDAVIVCAYNDTDKCDQYDVADAIALPKLEERQEDLPRDKELIFYCN